MRFTEPPSIGETTYYGVGWNEVSDLTWRTSDLSGEWCACLRYEGDWWVMDVISGDGIVAMEWQVGLKDTPPPLLVASSLLTIPSHDSPWCPPVRSIPPQAECSERGRLDLLKVGR